MIYEKIESAYAGGRRGLEPPDEMQNQAIKMSLQQALRPCGGTWPPKIIKSKYYGSESHDLGVGCADRRMLITDSNTFN